MSAAQRLGRDARGLAAAGLLGLTLLTAGCSREGPAPVIAAVATPPAPADDEPTSSHREIDAADETLAIEPRFLAAHQSASGLWEAAGFDRWRMGRRVAGGEIPGLGKPHNDVAVTALVTHAYLGAGYTSRSEAPMGRVVEWALHALRAGQAESGCLSRVGEPMWATNHALALSALVVAAGMTDSERDAEAADRAMDFYLRSSASGERAWRAERGPGGLPPIAWIAYASQSARLADHAAEKRGAAGPFLFVDDEGLEKVRREVAAWVRLPDAERSAGRLGLGIVLAIAEEKQDPKTSEELKAAGEWLAAHAPRWSEDGAGVDLGGWWLGTLGAFQVGGTSWKRWESAMKTEIIDRQRKDGDGCGLRGSWDPLGDWGDQGGRIYSSAAATLSLEVWYRYDKVFGAAPDRSPERREPAEAPKPAPRRPDDAPPPRQYAPCR